MENLEDAHPNTNLADAIVDAAGLAQILGRCKKTVERAVRRGELPRPFRFMGKNVWMRHKILAHLNQRQDEVLRCQQQHEKRIAG